MKRKSWWALAFALLGVGAYAATAIGTYTATAVATPSSGVTTTYLANKIPFGQIHVFDSAFPTSHWRAHIRTHGLSDGYVVDNVFTPGGTTGWHSHPGPSLIFVVRGSVTDYESSDPHCAPHTYSAGSGFVDAGGTDVHELVNEGDVDAETIAVQLVPSGADRKIDAPQPPANCQP